MNLKPYTIAGAATVGAGALIFGGTAVSTSFSSEASGNVGASAEHISIKAPEAQNLTLNNLRPGTSESTKTFHIDNTQGASGELSLINVGYQVVTGGDNGQNQNSYPDPHEITVTIADTNTGAPHYTYNLADLIGHNTDVAPYLAGYNEPFQITFKLAQTAGNEWNGASVNVPFTLHLQDNGVTSND